MRGSITARAAAVTGPLLLLALAGCSNDESGVAASGGGAPAGPLTVSATEQTCEVSTTTLPAGAHTFTTTNTGTAINEVYVYQGDRALAEAENIAPGLSRRLTVQLPEGELEIACKPGGVGFGIRSPLTVTPATTAADAPDARVQAAVDSYRTYVQQQADIFVEETAGFVAAVKAGDIAKAKALYPVARQPWERIEPVAESFGDLDPRIDAREGDVPDAEFGGYHRLEQALWQEGSLAGTEAVADQLLADAKELQALVRDVELTPDQLGNGANALLVEVSTTKVTGEEERYSRTDLVDFAANIEGSQAAYTPLAPLVRARDEALATDLEERFIDVQQALEEHTSTSSPGGYVSYDVLTEAEIRELSTVVDAFAEPLSRVTEVVVTGA